MAEDPTLNGPGAPMADAGQQPDAAAPQPQAVASPTAQPPQVAAAPAAVPPAASSKNPHLHSFVTSVLGALAGRPGPSYQYDDKGKLVSTPAPRPSIAASAGRIASTALTGLAAGSQVGPQKSGLANVAAGLGAGAGAIQEQTQKQDILKREQAKEDFESQQQEKLRRMEIGKQNALTMSVYYGNKKAANDLNPLFAQNESLYKAAKESPEIGAHVREMTDSQVEQEAAKDDTFAHTHIIKPMGWVPDTDATGNQVMTTDADGNPVPKFSMRMAVIDGTQDGKIAITPEMAADLKKYGSIARIPNVETLRAGDQYELSELLPVMNKVEEARKSVLQGWEHSELGWVTGTDGKQIPVETNKMIPVGDPERTRPLTVKPVAMGEAESKIGKEAAETTKDTAQAVEADAKAKEALANAALLSQTAIVGNDKNSIPAYLDAISQLPASSQTILRGVSPTNQAALLSVANYDDDLHKVFPASPRKGTGVLPSSQAETLVKLLNPNWSGDGYIAAQKLKTDFTSGPASQQINSFNQFFGHAGQAMDIINQYKTSGSPLVNRSLNWLRANMAGDPQVTNLMRSLEPVNDEWLMMVQSGKAPDSAQIERAHAMLNPDLAIGQLAENLPIMGEQGFTRIDQLNEQWKQLKGTNAPNLVRQTGFEGAKKLGLEQLASKYNTGGQYNVRVGETPNTAGSAPSASNIDWNRLAPNVDRTKVHTDGKIVIGWDPTAKKWVEGYTGKPYQQTAPPAQGAQ